MGSDGLNCVNACGDDELVDTGVCKKCSSFAGMDYCETCTSTNVCTKCTSGYIKEDLLGCIGTCPAGVGTCTTERTIQCIDVTGVKCVDDCSTTPEQTFISINKAKPVFIYFILLLQVMCEKLQIG